MPLEASFSFGLGSCRELSGRREAAPGGRRAVLRSDSRGELTEPPGWDARDGRGWAPAYLKPEDVVAVLFEPSPPRLCVPFLCDPAPLLFLYPVLVLLLLPTDPIEVAHS